MQSSDFISLGASISALFAAFIALASLLELIRQRKSSYKPDLMLLPKVYKIEFNDVGEQFPLFWVNEQSNSKPFQEIQIVNVGLGVAKKVELKWSFDTQKLITEICQSCPSDRPFEERLKCENNELYLKVQNADWELPLTSQPDNNVPYLIPAILDKTDYFLNLPSSYESLLSLLIANKLSQKISLDMTTVEPLRLTISYIDIGNYKHVQKFKLMPVMESAAQYGSLSFTPFEFSFSLEPSTE